MILQTMTSTCISALNLPLKINGQYMVYCANINHVQYGIARVEAVDNDWHIKPVNNTELFDSGVKCDDIILSNDEPRLIAVKNSLINDEVVLYAEPVTDKKLTYVKYAVGTQCELSVGNNDSCNIQYKNDYVSGKKGGCHARLNYSQGSWQITDYSTNGVFVNKTRIRKSEINGKNYNHPIKYGDIIYIMGLKLVAGHGFFGINNPENSVTAKGLNEIDVSKVLPNTAIQQTSDDVFFRSPRFKTKYETETITIDPPPALAKTENVPLSAVLGPSLTMGIASLSAGALTFLNTYHNGGALINVLPSLTMSGSMVVGAVLWPLLTRSHQRKNKKRSEDRRTREYEKYLSYIGDRINSSAHNQLAFLEKNSASYTECTAIIASRNQSLWGRMIAHDDFLKLRLGIGTVPFQIDLKYPENKFSVEKDYLYKSLYAVAEEIKEFADAPVNVDLVNNNILGVIGERGTTVKLIKSLIIQAATLHSPDELKIAVIAGNSEKDIWSFAKWLPHIWSDNRETRFFATDTNDLKALSAYFEEFFSLNETQGEENGRCSKSASSYFLIISADRKLAEKSNTIKKMLSLTKNIGYTFISLCGKFTDLPKDISSVIELNGNSGKVYDKNDMTKDKRKMRIEVADDDTALKAALNMSRVKTDSENQHSSLPDTLSFLDMFRVGNVKSFNSLLRWKENNPVISLQTSLGVNSDGELLMLDLHEKGQGPHGLIAGTTGSGKSEFVMTLILSIAVNYHPNEAAFVIIDFKGDSLAAAFEDKKSGVRLPHIAGTVTNLDGAGIKRALISINSEIKRREELFKVTNEKLGEGTVDIYKYQSLYREHAVSEPLPHLFIIADEFAELKEQQPEFMSQLITIARIGRSIGIHLVLATQKPSAVVDDEIKGNVNFRVCLKVHDKSESIYVLDRPNAVEIKNPGRFYLSVGHNDLFEIGQSAWSGAEYAEKEVYADTRNLGIDIIDNVGRIIKSERAEHRKTANIKLPKQLVSVVKYLSDLAKGEKIKVRPLWLDELPEVIFYEHVLKKYTFNESELNPVIGIYDDPEKQRQPLLTLPLTEKGNCIVFGSAGSGKTLYLTTVLYSLIRNYPAEILNLYIVDLESGSLSVFKNAPNVGDAVSSADTEKIHNIFKMIKIEIAGRKKNRSVNDDNEKYPNIVIVLHNYDIFKELYSDLFDDLVSVSREGINYGIYFIITAVTSNSVGYKLRSNFGQIFALGMNDKSAYSEVFGYLNSSVYISSFKGRGLVKSEEKIYEFQTARVCEESKIHTFINEMCGQLKKISVKGAPEIPVMPDTVNFDYIKKHIVNLDNIPIGVTAETCQVRAVNIRSLYIYQILSSDTYLIKDFLIAFERVVKLTTELFFVIENNGQAENQISEIFRYAKIFNEKYKSDVMMNEQLTVIIPEFALLYSFISDDKKKMLSAVLENPKYSRNIHFVICDSNTEIGKYASFEWYRRNANGKNGIWIGNGFNRQTVLRKSGYRFNDEIGDDFGYVVSGGNCELTKLLSSKGGIAL